METESETKYYIAHTQIVKIIELPINFLPHDDSSVLTDIYFDEAKLIISMNSKFSSLSTIFSRSPS